MEEIDKFINRMRFLGIEIALVGNFPWIYLDTVNGKKVTERFWAKHGFTIAFLPIRKDQKLKFIDIPKIFEVIRKYK